MLEFDLYTWKQLSSTFSIVGQKCLFFFILRITEVATLPFFKLFHIIPLPTKTDIHSLGLTNTDLKHTQEAKEGACDHEEFFVHIFQAGIKGHYLHELTKQLTCHDPIV